MSGTWWGGVLPHGPSTSAVQIIAATGKQGLCMAAQLRLSAQYSSSTSATTFVHHQSSSLAKQQA
eukprot:2674546-Amphidinium_carterae.1